MEFASAIIGFIDIVQWRRRASQRRARIQNLIVCRRSSRQGRIPLSPLNFHLDPPPGSGAFAFRISRVENCFVYGFSTMTSQGRILTLFLQLGCNGSSPAETKQTRNQCLHMEPNEKPIPRLADIEREVAAESRAWGRQRLQERLQQLAGGARRSPNAGAFANAAAPTPRQTLFLGDGAAWFGT